MSTEGLEGQLSQHVVDAKANRLWPSTITVEIELDSHTMAVGWDQYSTSSEGSDNLKAFDQDIGELATNALKTESDHRYGDSPLLFDPSSLGSSWQTVVAYDACLQLCVAKSYCSEAAEFLENDFALLRSSLCDMPPLSVRSKEIVRDMRVRVVKVRMRCDPQKVTVKPLPSSVQSKLSSCWNGIKTCLCTNKESYYCLLRLKGWAEGDAVCMYAGSSETCAFLPDNLEDDLIMQVQDSEGNYHGQVIVPVAAISEDPVKKLRWWSIYREPEHEVVGKIQLHVSYTTRLDDIPKYGFTYKTLAYDIVLGCAMKAQNFHQRNLLLYGKWKWLLSEFASYYEVSEAYTNLSYLSRVMDVATPTTDCISLVYSLLLPVMEGYSQNTLSHLEKRLLGEIKEQIERILALVFENYKSLDEQSPSGMMDMFTPVSRMAAPVLKHAVKLYALIHDISSPQAQNKLYRYFQAAAEKRSRHHLAETDEYMRDNFYIYPDAVSTACEKMKSLCLNLRNEFLVDVEIRNCNILPSFIDLPNLSSAIYNADLLRRFGAFLDACPLTAPSSHVTDVVVAIAGVVKDVGSWNIE